MAESGETDVTESWWGGWLQTAKEKGTAALDMVRKDLAEFGCTMQKDTGHVVEVTSSTLKDSLKAENTSAAKEKLAKGLNTFLEGISKALVVPPDDEGQIPIIGPSSDTYDRAKARIHAIQVDAGTYLHDPSGSPETYNMWCEGFDLDNKKGEISELLVSKAEVRGLYTKLVPARVSHVDFWRRYFYRLHQLDVDQARKEALMKRAESSRTDTFGWEDDWSGDEAADDSGSDWEKLPRPNQQQLSSASSISSSAGAAAHSYNSELLSAVPTEQDISETDTQQKTPVAQHQSDALTEVRSQDVILAETKQLEENEDPAPAVSAKIIADPTSFGHLLTPERLISPVQESISNLPPEQTVNDVGVPEIKETTPEELLDTQHSPEKKNAHAESGIVQPVDPKPHLQPVNSSNISSSETLSQLLEKDQQSLLPSTHIEQMFCTQAEQEDVKATEQEDDKATEQEGIKATEQEDDKATEQEDEKASEQEDDRVTELNDKATLIPVVVTILEAEPTGVGAVLGQEVMLPQAVSEDSSILKTEENGASSSVMTMESGEHTCPKTTERGDLVVVGSNHGSPVSSLSETKGMSDVDDEWEQDLDVELTEEDMKAAEELAKKLGEKISLDDDWESWE